MPENDTQQTTEMETVSVTPETAREKFEREQQARRQGLKRFGITPGFLNFAAKPRPQTPPAEPTGPQIQPGADWKDFEQGQVSRRAALRKMGVTTGMAVFALFSVDDLARMVGKAMEQRAKDSKVAEQVAKELRRAGVAMAAANPSGCPSPYPCEQCFCDQNTRDNICFQQNPNADPKTDPCLIASRAASHKCFTDNNCK